MCMFACVYYFHRTDAVGDCTGKVTSYTAAYYSVSERPAPAECSETNRCADLTGESLEKCLKKWAMCVKNVFQEQYGKVSMSLI